MSSLGETEPLTNISWTCSYKGEPLAISTWYDNQGWDFVGCIVDIQLKGKDGYFFVKYTGSIEGMNVMILKASVKEEIKKSTILE